MLHVCCNVAKDTRVIRNIKRKKRAAQKYRLQICFTNKAVFQLDYKYILGL